MNESLKNMNKKQQEMRLAASAKSNCRRRSQQRRKRAQWWFHQMRAVVDSAIDWKPADTERTAQGRLALSRSE
jgi:hypothetical protein